MRACVRAIVRVCVRARVHACMCMCVCARGYSPLLHIFYTYASDHGGALNGPGLIHNGRVAGGVAGRDVSARDNGRGDVIAKNVLGPAREKK